MVYYSFGVGIMRNLVKEIITGRWLKKMSNLTVNTKEKFSIQQIAAIGVMTAVICVLAPFSLPIGPVPLSLTNLSIYFGPTGGYLIGFIPMAIIAGMVINRKINNRLLCFIMLYAMPLVLHVWHMKHTWICWPH